MSDRRDEKLEKMLRSRPLRPVSPDLAERIVLKARTMPQNQALPLGQALRRLFAEFHLPRPAYVLAGTLLLGFLLGFNNPLDNASTKHASSVSAQSFLYADEDAL
jgi:hypothetical protein